MSGPLALTDGIRQKRRAGSRFREVTTSAALVATALTGGE